MINHWMNRVFEVAMETWIAPLLQHRIRSGSIQAVKAYIHVVKMARFALMGLFGIGAVAAVFVAGILLVIVGGIGLLPLEARQISLAVLMMGVVLSILSIVGLAMMFTQKRWLEMSKSYELMDAVLSPWPGVMPPNPVDVIKGQPASRGGLAHDIDLASPILR